MFFIISSYPKEEELFYKDNMRIHSCGGYQRTKIIMQYYVLSFFFLPIFKFKKRYFITYTCCGKSYELNKDIGREIERGNNPDIREEDYIQEFSNYNSSNKCPYCGYELSSDFDFCPKCGRKI